MWLWTRTIGRFRRVLSQWDAEQDRLVLWLPVAMGTGVLLYFDLRFEPPWWAGMAFTAPASLMAAALWRWQVPRGVLLGATALGIGFCASQFATARAPPPETGLPAKATVITGRIHAVELLADGRRITLDGARLDDTATPLVRLVRVRLRAADDGELATGDIVRVRALIRIPAPPAYPGAWDLQRDSFFSGLGASGFAISPVERLSAAAPNGPMRRVQWLREAIAARVMAAIPGAAGAVSVTLLTGASMAIPKDDHAAFRDSGLAHLLAVAGLHIGTVMGFAFTLARFGFALSAHASLFWPTKKLAALAALTVGAGYMVLTGMHVPIVRSFAMASLLTVAVMANRRPVSVRGLGLAACAIMLIEPWEVPGVSFQMSFSAVLALIAGYEALRPWLRRLHGSAWHRRLVSHIVALALTSALAGTASMPYGAYHFGHVQVYYVIANMAAVPLTAFWVLPIGLLSLPLMPFGLEWLLLVPMGWGADAVIWIAHLAASWPIAIIAVPHMPAWGLVVVSAGIAWLGIWRSPVRLLGIAPLLAGILSPVFDHPADVLISADARLIAVRTGHGVLMQQTQGGSKFTRDAWLQYWSAGVPAPMPAAGSSQDGAVACKPDACLLRPRPDARAALLVRGATRPEGCAQAAVIVSAEPARGLCPRPWPWLVDRFTVWRDGAAAVWLQPDGATVLTDRQFRGTRPWVPPPPVPRQHPAPGLPPALVDTGG